MPMPPPTKLMGDSIYTNPMMLGYAWQKGWVPLALRVAAACHRAQWRRRGEQQGRLRVGPPAPRTTARAVEQLLAPAQVIEFKKRETLDALVARRVEFLTAYQNAAYAREYRGLRGAGPGRRSAAGQDRRWPKPWRATCSS